jgi:GT2 family glycosyltransferase/tetratricopeptide (TPR) repeat protein
MVKLSLCVIVGKNEAFELERLLKSVQGPLFDEIVVTTTQEDPEVKAVATRYADKVPHFNWVKDFSAARNYCFDQSTGDHMMWLDADDVVTPENYAKLLDIKPTIQNYDIILLTYNYGHNSDGTSSVTLPRERIVKRRPELRWQDPIHEYLPTYSNMSVLTRNDICIDHHRKGPYNSSRNLEILGKVYSEGKASPRIKFYYAKDLIDSGNNDQAVKVFDEYLAGPTDFDQNKAVACIRMAELYLSKNDNQTAISYLRRGLLFNPGYAELHHLIGDFYFRTGDKKEAVKYYKEAASKDFLGLFAARPDFYKKFPLNQLCQIYYEAGDYANALVACKEFLKHYPTDENFIHNVKHIEGLIASGSKQPSTHSAPQDIQQPAKYTGDLKVAWMLPVINPVDPSQRIRRLNMHVALQNNGVDSLLLTNYAGVDPQWLMEKIVDRNVIVFSSFSQLERNMTITFQKAGKKVFADLNEAILDNSDVREMLTLVDGVICCSSKLMEMARPLAKILAVVEDPFEPTDSNEYDYFRTLDPNYKPTALYIGMGGNSFLVTEHYKDAIEKAGYKLIVCTEWDNADIKWDLDTWQKTMLEADVILCPQRVEVQPAKSNIKATQAMSMGIPVIASPLQAYREIIIHGQTGFICSTKDQWQQALTELKDTRKRIQVGMNAKQASDHLSLPSLAKKWEETVRVMMTAKQEAPKQEVHKTVPENLNSSDTVKQPIPIIIPVYNGVEYLKACVTSIHMNTTYPYHIVLSDAGSNEETWQYLNTLKGITVLGAPGKRLNFSESCNAGIQSIGNARFFTLLNSDVLVSKGWLEALVGKMEGVSRLAACGVLSNCDRGWLHGVPGKPSYNMKLAKSNLELVPGMKFEQVMPHLDELNEFMAASNKEHAGKYVAQPWVAAYATIFAKSAIDDIGLFDPLYKNGCEDLDLCQRLIKMGYNIGQAIDSFVYHFGGVSRGSYQNEAREQYDAEDRYNHETYANKWKKKNIVIYTGPAWEPWNRAKVDAGMAGSETWAAETAAEFSRRGFEVAIFNDPVVDGEVDQDGVTYIHHSKLEEYLRYRFIDFTILSRTCEPPKYTRMHCNNVFVMVNDIWLSNDRNYNTYNWLVQKFAVLSDWHRDFFCEHHNLPKEKTMLTFNGVNQDLYADVGSYTKKNKVVYSSSPDRGLRELLLMMPKIKAAVPDFEIDVAYGFHNWESAAKQRNNPEELALIDDIKSLMQQPGVNYLGRINKTELAKVQKEAKVWAFPTWFSETFCITGVENGLAKNALVTTPYAGLLTTLGDAPSYIRGSADQPPERSTSSLVYQQAFIGEVVKLLTDEPYRMAQAEKAYNKVSVYTWGNAVDGWLKEFKLA